MRLFCWNSLFFVVCVLLLVILCFSCNVLLRGFVLCFGWCAGFVVTLVVIWFVLCWTVLTCAPCVWYELLLVCFVFFLCVWCSPYVSCAINVLFFVCYFLCYIVFVLPNILFVVCSLCWFWFVLAFLSEISIVRVIRGICLSFVFGLCLFYCLFILCLCLSMFSVVLTSSWMSESELYYYEMFFLVCVWTILFCVHSILYLLWTDLFLFLLLCWKVYLFCYLFILSCLNILYWYFCVVY